MFTKTQKMIIDYSNGIDLYALARKYDLDYYSVRRTLRRNGINLDIPYNEVKYKSFVAENQQKLERRREKQREANKRYYDNHAEECRKYSKQYRMEHPENRHKYVVATAIKRLGKEEIQKILDNMEDTK